MRFLTLLALGWTLFFCVTLFLSVLCRGWVTSLTSSLFSWFSQPFREPAAEDTQQEEKKEETEVCFVCF